MQISKINQAGFANQYRFLRQMKLFALMGATACVFLEKDKLEKKWRYYERFYPEPTQLQKTLVQEAYLVKERDARGIVDKTLEEKKYIDPETE